MCDTTDSYSHASPFPPIIQPSHQLVIPYAVLGFTSPGSLHALPFSFQGGPTLAIPAQPLFTAGTSWHGPYFMGPGFAQGEPCATSNLASPPQHPFGPVRNPQPTLDGFLFSGDDINLENINFPQESMLRLDLCQHTLNANTYHANPSSSNDPLGIIYDPAPSEPPAPTFLEQLADNHTLGLDTESGVTIGSNGHFPGTPSPIRSHSHQFLFESHLSSSTQMGSPLLNQSGSVQGYSPARPTPSRSFIRSVSAPLHTPDHHSSLRLDIPRRAHTRPSTPVFTNTLTPRSPTPPSDPATFNTRIHVPTNEPSPSVFDNAARVYPFLDNVAGVDEVIRQGTRRRRSDSGLSIGEVVPSTSDALVSGGSEAAPHAKRTRLFDRAPTNRELDANASFEASKLFSERKYHAKEGAPEPKKGAAMGSFSKERQWYMKVARVSIKRDQVMRAPWGEPESEVLARAIQRADSATKMVGEEFAREHKFKKTMLRSDASGRSKFADPGMDLVNKGYHLPEGEGQEGARKESVAYWMAGDQYLFASDAREPSDFFKNSVVMDMTVELFFIQGSNLAGFYMRDMLRADDLEERRRLFTLTAQFGEDNLASTFDYADMSADALCGPPIAAIAFAGIALLHVLKKIQGTAGAFSEMGYIGTWRNYVRALIEHPELGWIRARIFEKMKHKYAKLYCTHPRKCSPEDPQAWEWRDELHD